MERFSRKGPGRPRKALVDAESVIESQDDAGNLDNDRETSEARIEAPAQSRRARERRQISILGRMMTGDSFLLKR